MLQFFEIYENIQAHMAHQETSHFKGYKQATTAMVKSIVRVEASAIALESKQITDSPKN
jgi:quinol monooxygenase YgiN